MKQIITKLSKISLLHFVVFFLLLGFVYNFQETMFYRPQSLHYWRQTDCLAITQNYYQRDNKFFEPEIYNVLADKGTSGKTAGEFPLLYYSVAKLWQIIGKSEFAYRLVVLILSFIGLYAIFRFCKQFLKNDYQSLIISLILFTSVTFVYYSASFLPNIPALSLILVAWYFIWKFYKDSSGKCLWIAMFFFTLGMLLKVSAGISFCALLGWFFIEFIRKKQNRTLFKKPLVQILPFLVTILLVLAWYMYAEKYNLEHKFKYTFNGLWPIWKLSHAEFVEDIKGIRIIWIHEFFHQSVLWVSLSMWVFLLITYKRRSLFQNYLLVIIPIGSFLYSLLWFQAFNGHDYYWIDFFIIIVMVWILFFKTMDSYSWFNYWAIKLIILGFFVFNVVKCEKLLGNRYVGWKNKPHLDHLEAVGELEPILRDLGVEPDDRVISLPDKTFNASLYLMNQQGYNSFNHQFDRQGAYEKAISLGAKYLIVNDTILLNDSLIKPYTHHLMTTYKNVKIYSLKEYQNRETSSDSK